MVKEIKEIALAAAEAADDKKAENVKILDVKDLTIIADFFVICSGNSKTQVKAIADGVEEELHKDGISPQRMAGNKESGWILLDFADIIVHVFHKSKRNYYELERLWADAEEILMEQEL